MSFSFKFGVSVENQYIMSFWCYCVRVDEISVPDGLANSQEIFVVALEKFLPFVMCQWLNNIVSR